MPCEDIKEEDPSGVDIHTTAQGLLTNLISLSYTIYDKQHFSKLQAV